MTWVLIVFSVSIYGAGATSVPGYKSEQDCKAAAAILNKAPDGYKPAEFHAKCIPGPSAP
jgi:hypothetical protein